MFVVNQHTKKPVSIFREVDVKATKNITLIVKDFVSFLSSSCVFHICNLKWDVAF